MLKFYSGMLNRNLFVVWNGVVSCLICCYVVVCFGVNVVLFNFVYFVVSVVVLNLGIGRF